MQVKFNNDYIETDFFSIINETNCKFQIDNVDV